MPEPGRPSAPGTRSSIAQITPGADGRSSARGDGGARTPASLDGGRGGRSDHASGGATAGRVAATGAPDGRGTGSDYDAYYARLRQRLAEVLRSRYPQAARQRRLEGTVQLEIDVEPTGAIGTVTVVSSSSHEVLDRAAVDAVRSLSRVPFPSHVRPRALKVRLPVVFEVE
jgi:TonB family protein